MPIYDLTYKGKTYSIESESPLSEQEIDTIFKNDIEGKELPESKPTETPLKENETAEQPTETTKPIPTGVGLGQSAVLGATFGTAPLIAGGINALKKMPRQELAAILPESLEKYADRFLGKRENLGEAFKKGKSDFLESQQQYAKEAPTAAMLAEIAGGFAVPMGSAGAVAKGLSALQKIKKGAVLGAGLGSAYGLGTGLSQTKDKTLDVKEGIKGLLTGGGVGLLGGTVASAIPAGISKFFQTKYKGTPSAYIRPKGTQIKTVENIIENPEIRKEAMRGDLGMRYTDLSKDASNDIIGLKDKLKDIVAKEYAMIPKNTKINLTTYDTLRKMNKAILDFENNTKYYPDAKETEKALTIFKNIANNLKESKANKGQKYMPYKDLKILTQNLYDYQQKAYKDDNMAVYNLYKTMRKALVEARDYNPMIKNRSKMYNDLESGLETLENGLGIKLDNPKNIQSKIFSGSRDASGEYAVNQIDEVMKTLGKYPETKELTKIHDKIKLAQTAYDLRPPEESKLLAQIKDNPWRVLTLPLKMLEEPSAQTMAKKLAKNIESGKLTPEDLKSFDIIKGGTALNKFIQKQKAYGGKISSVGKGIGKMKLGTYALPRITIKELLKEKE